MSPNLSGWCNNSEDRDHFSYASTIAAKFRFNHLQLVRLFNVKALPDILYIAQFCKLFPKFDYLKFLSVLF